MSAAANILAVFSLALALVSLGSVLTLARLLTRVQKERREERALLWACDHCRPQYEALIAARHARAFGPPGATP